MHSAALRAHGPQVRSEPVPRGMGVLQRELYVPPAFIECASLTFPQAGFARLQVGAPALSSSASPRRRSPRVASRAGWTPRTSPRLSLGANLCSAGLAPARRVKCAATNLAGSAPLLMEPVPCDSASPRRRRRRRSSWASSVGPPSAPTTSTAATQAARFVIHPEWLPIVRNPY